MSVLLVALALGYLAYPDDIIPDSGPYGLADDGVVCLLCIVAACAVAPARLKASIRTAAIFNLRVLHTDVSNFALLQHRYVDGFLISGKNSGSHWLKYMLSIALAERYALPPPRFTSGPHADAIVGRASRARSRRGYPQIATSHTIPSILFAWIRLPRWIRQPPVVLLLRNIPDALVSNFRKWERDYGVGLSEFMRGDPSGRRFVADVWWYVRFFNNWGAMHRRSPARVLVVYYEDLLEDPAAVLARVATHFRLDLTPDMLDRAARHASKDAMRALQDPNAGETIVPRRGDAPPLSVADWTALAGTLSRHLRHHFGYHSARAVSHRQHGVQGQSARVPRASPAPRPVPPAVYPPA